MKSLALGVLALVSLPFAPTLAATDALSLSRVIGLCRSHPSERFAAITIRGYFVPRIVSIEVEMGGAGGLYSGPHHQRLLWQGDTTPFVQVDWRGHGRQWIRASAVVVRGSFSCLHMSPHDFPAVQRALLLATSNSGQSWRRVPVVRANVILGLHFDSASRGWISVQGLRGGEIRYTANGGRTWKTEIASGYLGVGPMAFSNRMGWLLGDLGLFAVADTG